MDSQLMHAEWRIAHPFVHKGVMLSPGEPVPADLTVDEAEALYRDRMLAKIGKGGETELHDGPEPTTAEEFLSASDLVVLRRIRRYRPSKKVLKQMVAEIEVNGRGMHSPVLLEALKLQAGIPLSDTERII